MPTSTAVSVSQQVVNAVTQFISAQHTMSPAIYVIEMSSLTYNFLAAEDPTLILDPNITPFAFRQIQSYRTKLGFPFPKPDGVMKVNSLNIFIYFDDKMKLMKLRMSLVQAIHKQKTLRP